MEVNKYMRDGEVLTLTFGKIAYDNPKRKTNLAQVEFGWRMLKGNKEPYFTTTGGIWNCRHTDYVTCGASVHETIAKYVKDPILKKIVEYGKKYHLMDYSKVPKKDRKEIDDFIKGIVEENGVEKNDSYHCIYS